MIKCVIFDLDGTLLKTLPTITYYLNRMHDRYGLPHIDEEVTRGIVGNGAKNLVRRSLTIGGAPVDEIFEEAYRSYTEEYDRDSSYLTVAYPGMTEMLDGLLDRGIKLAVYTNKPATCAPDVVRSVFGDRFARVLGAEPSRPLKPAPDGGLEVLAELGISPSECAYVGDMTVDAKTAKAMGVALLVLEVWGFGNSAELEGAGPDAIISHPSELLSLIDGYNRSGKV